MWQERSSPHTAKSAPDTLKWVSLKSHHQYGGARPGSGPWQHYPEIGAHPTHQHRGVRTGSGHKHYHIEIGVHPIC